VTLKVCRKCNTAKPSTTDFFYKQQSSKDGLFPNCKRCESNRDKARRKSSVPKYNQNLFKVCSICKISKEITKKNFAVCTTGTFGVHSQCKKCSNEDLKSRRDANRRKERPIRNFVNIKKCGKCKEIFLTAAFCYDRNTKDGFMSICLPCVVIRPNSRRKIGDPIDSAGFLIKLEQFEYKCAYCKINPFEHIDHFYPLKPRKGERAGDSHIENLFPSCAKCNHNKSNKDPHEWLAERFPLWADVSIKVAY
jgi:5-methylcytosine-specific restriction endonuclease McrA